MAMPSVDKTYQFAQQFIGGSGSYQTDCKYLWWYFKEVLKGFGTAPWTVTGSSDTTTAGMDGNDRWTDISKLVTASTATASWIVLRQTGVGTNFEICIHLRLSGSTAYNNVAIGVSYAGFTGGSTTARPTATDEQFWYSATSAMRPGQAFAYNILAFHSTDGEVNRVIFLDESGEPAMYFAAEKPKNPVSGWTTPWLASYFYTSAGTPAFGTALNTSARYIGRNGSTNFTAYLSGEGYISSLLTARNRQSSITGKHLVSSMGVVSETSGVRGRIGQVYDMWWVPRLGAANLINLWPDDSTRKYIQVVDCLLPWNGLNSSPGTAPNFFPT